jgi:hypothetical protein
VSWQILVECQLLQGASIQMNRITDAEDYALVREELFYQHLEGLQGVDWFPSYVLAD